MVLSITHVALLKGQYSVVDRDSACELPCGYTRSSRVSLRDPRNGVNAQKSGVSPRPIDTGHRPLIVCLPTKSWYGGDMRFNTIRPIPERASSTTNTENNRRPSQAHEHYSISSVPLLIDCADFSHRLFTLCLATSPLSFSTATLVRRKYDCRSPVKLENHSANSLQASSQLLHLQRLVMLESC